MDQVREGKVLVHQSAKESVNLLARMGLDGAIVPEVSRCAFGVDVVEAVQLQPLGEERFDEEVRFFRGEHPVELLEENLGVRKSTGLRHLVEFLVGRSAPEEVREAAGKLEVIEFLQARTLPGWGFIEIEETRGGQDDRERFLQGVADAFAVFARVFVDLLEVIDVAGFRGPMAERFVRGALEDAPDVSVPQLGEVLASNRTSALNGAGDSGMGPSTSIEPIQMSGC